MKNSSILVTIAFLLFGFNLFAQDSVKEYPASSEEIVITIENDSIAVLGMLAAGSEKKETVLLLHGLPGNERNLDLAQELRRNGKNVIYFNYRGAWGSQGEFLFSNCIEDVKEVMDFFSTKENSEKYKVNPESFILFGHSMGGGMALISGATDARVSKIAVYSPWNIARGPQPTQDQAKGFVKYMESLFMLNVIRESFLKDIELNYKNFSILKYKEQLMSKKILIIDENDRNKEWIDALGNVDYITMKTDHSFSDKRLELIATVLEWINN